MFDNANSRFLLPRRSFSTLRTGSQGMTPRLIERSSNTGRQDNGQQRSSRTWPSTSPSVRNTTTSSAANGWPPFRAATSTTSRPSTARWCAASRARIGRRRRTGAGCGTRREGCLGPRFAHRALARILLRIADRMEEKLDLLAMIETIDNGKPIRETTHADLPLAIDHFRYFAGCLRAAGGAESARSTTTRWPIISMNRWAWWARSSRGFSAADGVWKLAPALAAGNCIVLKPAEQTPMSIMVLMDILGDIIPPGVVYVVNGFGVEAGKPLAQNKAHCQIASQERQTTGRLCAIRRRRTSSPSRWSLAASRRTSSSPTSPPRKTILRQGARRLHHVALNQGEVCTCPSRALVHESIYDRFVDAAIKRVQKIKMATLSTWAR